MIYPVDSVIQPLNNWGQENSLSLPPDPGVLLSCLLDLSLSVNAFEKLSSFRLLTIVLGGRLPTGFIQDNTSLKGYLTNQVIAKEDRHFQ